MIIESDNQLDIPHSMLWKDKVAYFVADKYNILYEDIKDLCYALMRGRVSEPLNKERLSRRHLRLYKQKNIEVQHRVVFFGENNLDAIQIIRKYYPKYPIQYDSHHIRQDDDVFKFQLLLDVGDKR